VIIKPFGIDRLHPANGIRAKGLTPGMEQTKYSAQYSNLSQTIGGLCKSTSDSGKAHLAK